MRPALSPRPVGRSIGRAAPQTPPEVLPPARTSAILFGMGWTYLLIAGLAEIVWAVGLKMSDGWTRLWPSVITLVFIVISYFYLSLALKSLPLGTAYAIWTGIGALGAALAGILFFGEPRHAARLICIGLIVIGILGLKAAS